ncbi:MAG: hypothetical protein WCL37_02275 [Chrysiogenales bacterium]
MKKKKLKMTFKTRRQRENEQFMPVSVPAPLAADELDEDEPRSPLDRAQDIVYDAWEEANDRKRVAMARKALSISPVCDDAYMLLAQEHAQTLEEVIALYKSGVAAGERALGPEAFNDDAGHFWGILATRPYMRVRQKLAESLWLSGKREEAAAHFREMLRLNPGDNQGIRYQLMPCLIELDCDKEAEALYKVFKNDAVANWSYARALLDFRKSGDSPRGKKLLTVAIAGNKYIPAYLLGKKQMPHALPSFIQIGEEDEAVAFTFYNLEAWRATAGALDWLAQQENLDALTKSLVNRKSNTA